MNLLVIENDRTCREVICFFIEEQGHSAEGLPASEFALARLKGKEFDAVLLDLDLGQINGLDLLSEILRRRPEMSVVMYASEIIEKSAAEAMRRGAVDFLQTPFPREQFDKLLTRLQRLRGRAQPASGTGGRGNPRASREGSRRTEANQLDEVVGQPSPG